MISIKSFVLSLKLFNAENELAMIFGVPCNLFVYNQVQKKSKGKKSKHIVYF